MSNHEARADAGSILRHRPLTYRVVKHAAGELARFLHLSLVSCPIYLSPLTVITCGRRLHNPDPGRWRDRDGNARLTNKRTVTPARQ
jgi:hypothetical protein